MKKNRNKHEEAVLTVKLPKPEAEAFRESAIAQDLTVSQLLRKLIRLRVQDDEKQAA
jgi:hypothetical protein